MENLFDFLENRRKTRKYNIRNSNYRYIYYTKN